MWYAFLDWLDYIVLEKYADWFIYGRWVLAGIILIIYAIYRFIRALIKISAEIEKYEREEINKNRGN